MSDPIYIPRSRRRPRRPGEADRAIAFVPNDDNIDKWTLQCLDHGAKRGYNSHGVVVGNWEEALSMLLDDLVDVIVVARREHAPDEVLPRIEFVEDGPRTTTRPPRVEVADPLASNGPPQPGRRRPRPIE